MPLSLIYHMHIHCKNKHVMNWSDDSIVQRLAEIIGQVLKTNKFALISGTMRPIRVRMMFCLERPRILGDRISFKKLFVSIEFKYE